MMRFHAMVLILCGAIGFTGHYLQFGVARLTPWIPASVGIFILLAHFSFQKRGGQARLFPIIPVLVFGVIVTMMCIKFLPQDVQPMRKKIIFIVMSVSSWVTVLLGIRELPGNDRDEKNAG